MKVVCGMWSVDCRKSREPLDTLHPDTRHSTLDQYSLTVTFLIGILNIDKPAGLTSARAVGIVKRLLPKGTKIGHAGTLDPFATGVLLLLVGKATKTCERLMDEPKQYEATVRFGATTGTDDLESEQTPWRTANGGE